MHPKRSSGSLVEREEELAVLRAAAAAAATGEGGLVVLEAIAGSGKTRLLLETVDLAQEAGLRVLRATGGELEATFPFGVMRQLLERPVRSLGEEARADLLSGVAALAARALGLQGVATPGPDALLDPEHAARHGLYWLVAGLAEDRPLALLVDDGHWVDEPSVSALEYLARRLDGLPVLLVLAARPDAGEPAVRSGLDRLAAGPRARSLRLHPLSPQGVASVAVTRGLDTPDTGTVSALHHATSGNPFLLDQLLLALDAEGVSTDERAVRAILEAGPTAIGRSIVLRLGRRSAEALALAQAVALLTLDSTLADAAALAGLEPATAAGAADELVVAGILDADTRVPRFVHPLVRTAVHGEIPTARRGELHERAAGLLQARHAPVERVALHLLASPPRARAETVTALLSAAESARASASPGSAARFLQRALDEPPAAEARPAIQALLGHMQHLSGASREGLAHLESALAADGPATDRAHWVQWSARAAAIVEGPDGAFRRLEREADRVADTDPETALLLQAAGLQTAIMHPPLVPAVRERLAALGPLAGETPAERLLLALMTIGACYSNRGATAVADLARRALGGGRLLAEATAESSFSSAAYAWALTDLDRDALLAELDAAVTQGRDLGGLAAYSTALGARAHLHLRAGRVDLAAADAQGTIDALTDLERGPIRLWTAAFAIRSLVDAHVLRGELAEADALLEREGFAGPLPDWVPVTRLYTHRAALRLAQGRLDEAADDLRSAEAADARGMVDTPPVSWRIPGVLVHLRRHETERAREIADAHLERARRWDAPGVTGDALRLRALCEEDPRARRDGLASAVQQLAGADLPLAHLEGLLDLGTAQRITGARKDAVATLQQAAELALELGAPAPAERARQELLACGQRPRRLAFSGVEALTPSERRIAEMVAGGASNRDVAQALFVTPKTVENHLGRVYTKLGVRRRSDLAAELAGAGQT